MSLIALAFGQEEKKALRTRPMPNCSICKAKGNLIYEGLNDRLYGVPGKWNLRKCLNPDCSLIWLDPIPLEEDIIKTYKNYYTHEVTYPNRNKLKTRLFRLVKEAYWAKKYSYSVFSAKGWRNLLPSLMYFFPLKRAEIDAALRYLPAQVDGHLIDIGCGNGEWLEFMQKLGWHIEGVDIDPDAVSKAINKGLPVHSGTLIEKNYPNDYFDAVAMFHVTEHVISPSQLLRECLRILKPGGRLVLISPNPQSLGHKIFKQNWRGLEPPRHLNLINLALFKKILKNSGFEILSAKTTVTNHQILKQSSALSKNIHSNNGELPLGKFNSQLVKLITILELILIWVNKNIGEEILLIAQKPATKDNKLS